MPVIVYVPGTELGLDSFTPLSTTRKAKNDFTQWTNEGQNEKDGAKLVSIRKVFGDNDAQFPVFRFEWNRGAGEGDRKAAGGNLAICLRVLMTTFGGVGETTLYVATHSHGGNVMRHALTTLAEGFVTTLVMFACPAKNHEWMSVKRKPLHMVTFANRGDSVQPGAGLLQWRGSGASTYMPWGRTGWYGSEIEGVPHNALAVTSIVKTATTLGTTNHSAMQRTVGWDAAALIMQTRHPSIIGKTPNLNRITAV